MKFEYKITLAYLSFGVLWILFSDQILNSLISEEIQRANIQMYKGWFYVLLTAVFLFFLVRKHLKKLRDTEDILEQKNTALSQAHNKAEESSRLKTAFLNNISHELRTPMNGILGFTELLTRSDIEQEKNSFIVI
ncbi:MAG: histidine kinase dimerization/phospho-acceptor domain-containing protein [Candidatus Neomarinimicrobiota bacterium]